jgi:hypothetical protein
MKYINVHKFDLSRNKSQEIGRSSFSQVARITIKFYTHSKIHTYTYEYMYIHIYIYILCIHI